MYNTKMIPIRRNQTDIINQLLSNFPIVAILGARQVGKTTLAKQLRPNWRYVDLENPNDYELVSRDPVLFFEQFETDIIIDEAQNYPNLFNILRGIIDKKRALKGRFILTGSSSPELTKQISESLAGRIAHIEIGTLKANEYFNKPLSDFYDLFQKKIHLKNLIKGKPPITKNNMNTIWLKGGYPEPLLNDSETFHSHWMENYYYNYVNRDVAKLFPKLNKIKYQRFIKILSSLSGTIINKSNLARALEISEGSAREYLKITEGTFLWRQLESFESSKIKSTIKMPKGYMRDSGLLHYLLNIRTQEDLFRQTLIGQSFESFVIEEIVKGLNATDVTNYQAYYYRTRKGSEIDLILEGYFGLLPIEIKYSSSVKTKQLKALNEFIETHNLPLGIVVNKSEETLWLTDKIIQIPVGWL